MYDIEAFTRFKNSIFGRKSLIILSILLYTTLHNTPQSARPNKFQTGSTAAHRAAQDGDVKGLEEVLDLLEGLVNKKDANGWTPLHEGARGGHLEVVQLLVDNGAALNDKSNNGETALYWAEKEQGEFHPVSKLLKSLGAISLGPDL